MSDLTRLRNIVLSGDLIVALSAAVLFHMSESQTKHLSFNAESARRGLDWLSNAPFNLFGEIVGGALGTPAALKKCLDQLTDSDYPLIATAANAMVTPNKEWDRDTRNYFADSLVGHRVDAARATAQSSMEFAALDSLTEAGYDNMQHAVNEVNLVKQLRASRFHHFVRQFARSRHAIACCIEISPGEHRPIITPWCLSKPAAYAYVAVLVSGLRKQLRVERAARLASTVMTYDARSGLESVRRIVEPAAAILSTYTYSSSLLAFVDETGRVRETIQTRSPPVLAAFAAISCAGASDVLMSLANMRVAAAGEDAEPRDTVREYFDKVDNEETALLLFSRVLADTRRERDVSDAGPRLNKDPMLGYLARGISRSERNTQACINRALECVSSARSRGVDMSNTIVMVEWGGALDYPQVLASLALAKIDVCIDVGMSGSDLPGLDVVGENEDPICSMHLLLASAKERGLPRMPVVHYRSSDALDSKVFALMDYYDPKGDSGLIYVSGGVVREEGTPVSVCSDANARIGAMRSCAMHVPLRYAAVEALIPPLCAHGAEADVDDYIETLSQVDEDCPACNAHYRSVVLLSSALAVEDCRMVKPRSSYGHNGHVSLEFIPGMGVGYSETATTTDSMVVCNVLRNREWESPPVVPPRGGNPTSKELSDLMSGIINSTYGQLTRGERPPIDIDDVQSVAQSITNL